VTDLLTQVGVGGALAIIIVREVLRYLGTRNGGPEATVRSQVAELHRWHAKEDADGVKVWYVRPSMASALASLAKSQAQLAHALERQADAMERMDDALARALE
jgi:hypothetical protein